MAADDGYSLETASKDNIEDKVVVETNNGNLKIEIKELNLESSVVSKGQTVEIGAVKQNTDNNKETQVLEISTTASNEKKNPAINQANSEDNASTSKIKNTNKENEASRTSHEVNKHIESIQSETITKIVSANEICKEISVHNIRPTNDENGIPQSLDDNIKLQKQSRRSNYSDNLRISNSNVGLSLRDGKDNKEDSLLSDSTTVVRFSPAWKQVTNMNVINLVFSKLFDIDHFLLRGTLFVMNKLILI